MSGWMINCKEHSRLASEGMDHPLAFRERISVKIHQWICPACARVKKQFSAIRAACRLTSSDLDLDRWIDGERTVLPDEACQRMKSTLRALLNK